MVGTGQVNPHDRLDIQIVGAAGIATPLSVGLVLEAALDAEGGDAVDVQIDLGQQVEQLRHVAGVVEGFGVVFRSQMDRWV
jgi:hypothetical protein